MKKVLLFGGTTEGRETACEAARIGCGVTLCVATEYGAEVLPPHTHNIAVNTGRMDTVEIVQLMARESFLCVIDATHPYAVEISKNIRLAAEKAELPYWRLLRGVGEYGGCRCADSIGEACRMAGAGNILAVTGSKEIMAYTVLEDCKERLYARVLPLEGSLKLCREAGLDEEHIIAEKGPFTTEQNAETMVKYNIKTMITKDGGAAGGFAEKLAAARQCGVQVIVIKRPRETGGFSQQEILQKLREVLP